jgi:hypothetical protein
MNYLKERAAGELELIRWREVMGNREPGRVQIECRVEIGNLSIVSKRDKLPNVVKMVNGKMPKVRVKQHPKLLALREGQAVAYYRALETGRWA